MIKIFKERGEQHSRRNGLLYVQEGRGGQCVWSVE